ncbi:unnamed protein product [Parascedosporium putredinis]|uniref:Repressor of RNA polymerase III transcription MAF1 n=1 Tax=Parascedosporium putredinis TaxID=1442378 RepID=A0A9P1M9E2_9PEZI|nr:unnamed protein product [Parascedosporium putredinis]CAI7995508.1 unnamed protein product [Parascedosporium putredinis]
MKYLPVPAFDTVTSALNFNTPDCNVTGGCDLYTTKSTGSDKKLYKNINDDLDSQHAELLRLGASLSPPQKAAMMATSPSLFSQPSAFGPLSELANRRTFAYLIATLNASHPHYDFSNVLRPGDFKRERSLRRIMANLDSILQNVRGCGDTRMSNVVTTGPAAVWSQHCWSLLDNEMRLDECTIFNYEPDIDPFEEDESAIWSVHYFFFNRTLKRVAYLYLRVVPVISSQSPMLTPRGWRAAPAPWIPAQRNAPGFGSHHRMPLSPRHGDLVPFSEDDYLDDDEYDLNDDGDTDMNRYSPSARGMSEDIAGRMEL